MVDAASNHDEEQGLLLDAAEPAFDSPAHHQLLKAQHHLSPPHATSRASEFSFSPRNILVDTSSNSFAPTTCQLQKAINESILTREESKKLSEVVKPVKIDKRETMC
jgi:hypothetical protein